MIITGCRLTVNGEAVSVMKPDDIIEISGRFMPIKIVTEWGVSIRPCEFKNYLNP